MSRREWRYLAWGIDVVVPFPVPELREHAGTGEPDLILRKGSPPRASLPSLLVLPSGARVALVGHEAFVDVDEATLLHPSLLRSILAVVLRGKGFAVLHAAALRFAGRTIVLAGPSGTGKTTLARAICDDGGALITDELCAIEWVGGTGIVLAATQTLAMRADGLDLAEFAVIRPDSSQRWRNGRVLVDVPAFAQASSMDALYLVQEGGVSGIDFTTLRGAELAQALLSARFQPDLFAHIGTAGELAMLGRIAAAGTTHRLCRAPGVGPRQVVDAIRAHLSA